MDTIPLQGCRRLIVVHEITEMCIMYPLWKTARIPLLSIGQGSEPDFAQLLCGCAESEDSTFCAKLTYNVTLCSGAGGGGEAKRKISLCTLHRFDSKSAC